MSQQGPLRKRSTKAEDAEVNNNESIRFFTDTAREEIIALIRAEAEASNKKKPAKPEGNLLPKDTFSFLVYAPVSSPAFAVALLCYVFQLFMLLVVAGDQFFSGNQTADNKLGVPAYATRAVRICQFLAITIAVICQLDLLWSINVLFKGFNKAAFLEVLAFENAIEANTDNTDSSSKEHSDGDSHSSPGKIDLKYLKLRWIFSAFARLSIGLLSLACMFFLIMRSETGRAVLLSFSAVNFIGTLDNALYGLAQWGYMGPAVKHTADSLIIGDVDFAVVAKRRRRSQPENTVSLKMWRILALVGIWVVLECFWLWITLRQRNGDFLPSSIYVQFGDDEVSALGLLSGIYDVRISGEYVRYTARPSINAVIDQQDEHFFTSDTSVIGFRYCALDKFWTLEAHAIDDDTTKSYDVCKDWVVKSSTTGSNPWNILSVAGKSWQIKAVTEGRTRKVQMRSLKMLERPSECSKESYGPVCEFVFPSCETLAMNADAFDLDLTWAVFGVETDDKNEEIETPYFKRETFNRTKVYSDYKILMYNAEMVLAYNRPIYFATYSLTTAGDKSFSIYEVILCVGRRWARMIIGIDDTMRIQQLARKVLLLEGRLKRVDGDRITFRYVTHLTETFDVGTLNDRGTPLGLKWYQTSDSAEFKANERLQATDVLRCECPVCPDGLTSIPDENMNTTVQIDFGETSALYGQNLTCSDIGQMNAATEVGSSTCTSLQLSSIFECGCPYVRPVEQLCPLCAGDSDINDAFADHVPFVDGYFGNATCRELTWGSNLRAEFAMKNNERYCPTWQAVFGAECGCASPPPPPCDTTCPSGQVFETKRIVPYFEPDVDRNDWYCGELLAWMNIARFEADLCTEEWRSALADACCVAK